MTRTLYGRSRDQHQSDDSVTQKNVFTLATCCTFLQRRCKSRFSPRQHQLIRVNRVLFGRRLWHLWSQKANLPSKVLKTFHTGTTESFLTGSITAWFGNSPKQESSPEGGGISRSASSGIIWIDLETIEQSKEVLQGLSPPTSKPFFCSGSCFPNTERMRRSASLQVIQALNTAFCQLNWTGRPLPLGWPQGAKIPKISLEK